MHDPLRSNQRFAAKDFVYSEIKRKIVEGQLDPGQPINEMAVAEDLGVSRTPVREAVQRLETEELIIRLANGRLKVAPLSVKEVEEIFAVREVMEGLVAREAAMKATDEDLEVLRQITHQFQRASSDSRSEEVVLHGNEFHSKVGQISQNRTAIKILQQLEGHIYRYRRLGPTMNDKRSNQAVGEHEEMLQAITNRDAERAEALMRQHITSSLDSAVDSIKLHFSGGGQDDVSA